MESKHKTYFKEERVLRKNKDFSEDTRNLFCYNNECFKCGKNRWDVAHHTMGGDFEEADSPLNFCAIHNYPCHIGWSFDDKMCCKFLTKTLKYLIRIRYRFTQKDFNFIERFKDIYSLNSINNDMISMLKEKYNIN